MLRLTFAAAALIAGIFAIAASERHVDIYSDANVQCPETVRSPFRYVILDARETKYLSPDGGEATFRGVEVLLAPQSFSEGTLRRLFEMLSKRLEKTCTMRVASTCTGGRS